MNKDITFLEALGVSGIAIVIIMAVLSAIMGLIYLMSFILKKLDGKSFKDLFKKQTATEAEPKTEEPNALASGSCGQIKLFDVSDKDAAMIMAIVADSTKTPLNELRFISIKEVKGE